MYLQWLHSRFNKHTYICMSYLHTYIHTYVNTYIPTYMHTYVHRYIYTYLHRPIARGFGRFRRTALPKKSRVHYLVIKGPLLKHKVHLLKQKVHYLNHIILSIIYLSAFDCLSKILRIFSVKYAHDLCSVIGYGFINFDCGFLLMFQLCM